MRSSRERCRLQACRSASRPASSGPDKSFSAPTSFIEKDIVIIGAGVSGLSAAYHLNKAGMRNFLLLDLEGKTNICCSTAGFKNFKLGGRFENINSDL